MKINIIGAGLAGVSATLTLAESGIKSNLISVTQFRNATVSLERSFHSVRRNRISLNGLLPGI